MSGIEVAGIVLGAIPLFIAAAENYVDTCDKIEKFWRSEEFLRSYIAELTLQQTLLRTHLQVVVGKTDLPPKTQYALVENSSSSLWHAPDVQHQLRLSLKDTFDSFKGQLELVAATFARQLRGSSDFTAAKKDKTTDRERLEALVQQSQSQSQLNSLSWRRKFHDGVKFSWKSSRRASILSNFKACNEYLEKVNQSSESTKLFHKKQEVRKIHAAWQNRQKTRCLFDVLVSSCICSCPTSHEANIRIKPLDDDDGDDSDGSDTCSYSLFHLIVRRSSTEIHCVDVRIFKQRITSGAGRKPTVQIVVPASSNAPQDRSGWQAINDLCSTLGSMPNGVFNLAIDEAQVLYRTDIATQSGHRMVQSPRWSLQSLFPIFQQYSNARWLLREKLVLAIVSAYSVIQLFESPWILPSRGISSEQLFFHEDGTDICAAARSSLGGALGRPFICGKIESRSGSASSVGHSATAGQISTPVQTNSPRRTATSPPVPMQSRPMLESLGATLVELLDNRSLQDLAGNDPNSASIRRWQAIETLQAHQADEAWPAECCEAIRFCLLPSPGDKSRSIEFADSDFREKYYCDVILPLEAALHKRCEVPANFWKKL